MEINVSSQGITIKNISLDHNTVTRYTKIIKEKY